MEMQNTKRPLFVSMLCGFYFVYWAISLLALISALIIRIGSQFPAIPDILKQINLIFLGAQVEINFVTWLISLGLVAGVVGFWLFQKWSVIVFSAASVALFIVSLPAVSSAPTKTLYVGLIFYTLASIFAINITMIVVGVYNFKRMK